MAKPVMVMKINPRSKKPYMSRVVRNGPVQKWFKENIGDKTGQCVANLTRGKSGHTAAVQYAIAKHCAPTKGSIHVPEALKRPKKAINPAVMPR
jgi:hypothetical protein